jgi:murein DD-endopeptidase MepM/ murein hydrolase activator NlpD
MKKTKKILYYLTLAPIFIMLILIGWFFTVIFEGQAPSIEFSPKPEFVSNRQKIHIKIADKERGLKQLKVSLNQEGRVQSILDKTFPFQGLMNRPGIRHYETDCFIDPSTLNLAQGRVDLDIQVWDWSRRGGGDGNRTVAQHKLIVDTIPPSVRALSRMNNINVGGTCLVLYQASSDTAASGIFVGDLFFPGYKAGGKVKEGVHVCYFTVSYDTKEIPSIYLWAKDNADNRSTSTFYSHVRKKRFRRDNINISDRFLRKVLPYFSDYPNPEAKDDLSKYIQLNNDLRKENHQKLLQLHEKITPERLWDGPWLRMKNAATMAGFGDRRSYYYKGKKIDEQVHLGIDLASLANSPIQAANNGRVIFAGRLGIYGLTILLDHGQGLSSLYGHLNEISVAVNDEVKKGNIIGYSGQTGMAGGDHLHFSVLIKGIFVNPIEWWDPHWIKDNIERKLALLSP